MRENQPRSNRPFNRIRQLILALGAGGLAGGILGLVGGFCIGGMTWILFGMEVAWVWGLIGTKIGAIVGIITASARVLLILKRTKDYYVIEELDEWPRTVTRRAAFSSLTPPPPITDKVHFSLTGPPSMARGSSHILNIWAHLAEKRDEVIRLAREGERSRRIRIQTKAGVPVARGTCLTVRLSFPGFLLMDCEDTMVWDGEIASVSFPVTVPHDMILGTYNGVFTFHVAGLRIAKLDFDVGVNQDELPLDRIETREYRYCSAFASYASKDRKDVLARIHGIKKALPDLDVFLDVASLRSGDNWEERLMKEIVDRDVLYLFWSQAARQSLWVEREWRTALDHRGIDYIDPVPLVPPEEAPPPKELAALHFNDWTTAYMRSEEWKAQKIRERIARFQHSGWMALVLWLYASVAVRLFISTNPSANNQPWDALIWLSAVAALTWCAIVWIIPIWRRTS